MTTIDDVFNQAIMMMDEQSEENGNTRIDDTDEYRFRTIPILNTLLPLLYPYADSYNAEAPGRPAPPPLLYAVTKAPDFTQEIPLDDSLAKGVLPYGLAEHLLAPEDPELSAFFGRKWATAFLEIRENYPGEFVQIEPPYGLF